jgi:hypothetical protein
VVVAATGETLEVDVDAVDTVSARIGGVVCRCDICTALYKDQKERALDRLHARKTTPDWTHLAATDFCTICLDDRREATRDAMAKPSNRTLELDAKLFIVMWSYTMVTSVAIVTLAAYSLSRIQLS